MPFAGQIMMMLSERRRAKYLNALKFLRRPLPPPPPRIHCSFRQSNHAGLPTSLTAMSDFFIFFWLSNLRTFTSPVSTPSLVSPPLVLNDLKQIWGIKSSSARTRLDPSFIYKPLNVATNDVTYLITCMFILLILEIGMLSHS